MMAKGLRYSVDECDKEHWHDIVAQFDDATIHQTWSWGALRWSNEKLSHIVVYEGADVVAAAQVVTVSVPVIGAGIAHCKFGPMWRRRGRPERPELYAYILNAMRDVYERRRKLLLRVKPWEVDRSAGDYHWVRESVGMQPRENGPAYETFIVDLSRSLPDLRAGFSSKWRYNLKKSEKRGLEVKRGNDFEAATVFMQNYSEMRDIKAYVDNSEVGILPGLMQDLPEFLRPTVFTAMAHGNPAASIVISHLGSAAYYLFGGTGQLGRETGASYLLFWDALSWLKERECEWLDLVGARPKTPNGQHGYRQFKAGIVGNDNGREVRMADWEACAALRSRIVVTGGDWVRSRMLELKTKVGTAVRFGA